MSGSATIHASMHWVIKCTRSTASLSDQPSWLANIGERGVRTIEDARRYIEWGYRFVAVGTDIGLLAKNADALAAAFRKK